MDCVTVRPEPSHNPCCITPAIPFYRLAAIEREGGLAVSEQAAELGGVDLEKAGEALHLALAQAGKVDQAFLEFFPDIDAETQTASSLYHVQPFLCAQFAQGGDFKLLLAAEDAVEGGRGGALC